MQNTDDPTLRTRFNAKLMLFGEYSIIYNSMALTVPFKHFSGELSVLHDNKYTAVDYAKNSNLQLKHYAQHLHKQAENNAFDFYINTREFINDIKNGLYFESTIPQGYGAGSSGALIAAVYQKYASASTQYPANLRQQLASMENFFHGRSSGIDPLVSLLNKTLLVEGETLQTVQKPNFSPTNKEGLFLVDTRKTGKTEPLVHHFISMVHNKSIDRHYLQDLNNSIINSLLTINYPQFWKLLSELSHWQQSFMQRMIPEEILPYWQKAMEQNICYMKLCGSGGGGYMLAFAPDYEKAQDFFNRASLPIVPVQVPDEGEK
ncbi:MAG: hypothetical protein R6U85_11315 [Salinivirgaceae bacterium]